MIRALINRFPAGLLLLGMLCSGCGPVGNREGANPPAAEHSVPAHWPSDLEDADVKIQARMVWLRSVEPAPDQTISPDTAFKQLQEIVAWVPEIAADTPLSEADWMPVHQASESLSRRLRGVSGRWDETVEQELESFRELLIATARLLPPPSDDADPIGEESIATEPDADPSAFDPVPREPS